MLVVLLRCLCILVHMASYICSIKNKPVKVSDRVSKQN